MTPEDLDKTIHSAVAKALECQLPAAVSAAVTASVNGKIDALRKEFSPINEAWAKWLSWKRTVGVVFGIMLAIGGLISTVQALWAIVAGHLVIK